MNYIAKLQEENKELRRILENVESHLLDSKRFLMTEKFTGHDRDGERKDWLSTGDAQRMLDVILDSARQVNLI